MTQPFDFDQALKALQAGKSLTGKDSVLQPNRKNGTTSKTIKHPSGSFELDAPRDRK